jgi:hypothetical protein
LDRSGTAIVDDARQLIDTLNEQAYFEARERVRGRCIEGVRQARYWTAVKLEIARQQGIAIGLAGADMRGEEYPPCFGAAYSNPRGQNPRDRLIFFHAMIDRFMPQIHGQLSRKICFHHYAGAFREQCCSEQLTSRFLRAQRGHEKIALPLRAQLMR